MLASFTDGLKLNKIVKIILSVALSACVLSLWAALAAAAPLEVFVSIPPQKYLVDRLGGGYVKTHVLVGEGQSPHLFQPTSKQVLALSQAKVFFTVDMEFEHIFVHKLEESVQSLQVVNSVRSIEKVPLQNHDHHGGKHAVLDPHVWLAPANLKIMATNMAAALSSVDPMNEQLYKKNLESIVGELDELDRAIQKELAPFAGATFYVFHPSFTYFARSYNLHQEAVEVGGKSPTPKPLAALIAKAKKEKVKVLFVQEQFDPRSAQVVAQATGAKVLPLNPLAENVVGNLLDISRNIHSALSR